MYDVCLEFDGDTSLVVEEGAIFGGDGGYGTYTLINGHTEQLMLHREIG